MWRTNMPMSTFFLEFLEMIYYFLNFVLKSESMWARALLVRTPHERSSFWLAGWRQRSLKGAPARTRICWARARFLLVTWLGLTGCRSKQLNDQRDVNTGMYSTHMIGGKRRINCATRTRTRNRTCTVRRQLIRIKKQGTFLINFQKRTKRRI